MSRSKFLLVLLMVAVALPLRAQGVGGCDDSPEAPTVILAVVGGIGALAARLRYMRKR